MYQCMILKSLELSGQREPNAEVAACVVVSSEFNDFVGKIHVLNIIFSCTLFWKAFGIVFLGFALWYGFKLFRWATTVRLCPSHQ